MAGGEKSLVWRGGRISRRVASMEVVTGVKRKKKIEKSSCCGGHRRYIEEEDDREEGRGS